MDSAIMEEFESFVTAIREGASDEEIMQQFGGGNFYIPSWKRVYRNPEIVKQYREGASIKKLARKYQISERQIYEICSP